jgi:phosphate transport system permease protein
MTDLLAPDLQESFPTGDEYQKLLDGKGRRAFLAQGGLLLALILAVLALATLLYTIINDSFGLVAQVNQNEPEDIVASLGYDPTQVALTDLSKDELITVLQGGISNNVGRRLEREQRFYDDRLVFETQAKWDEVCAEADAPDGCTKAARDHANVLFLVEERIVEPDVIATNGLVPSILNPTAFKDEVEAAFGTDRFGDYTFDQVRFRWRAWLTWRFISSEASATPEIAGIKTAILGTLWLVFICVLFAVPTGVGAAIYLEEFARPSRINDLIQTNINNLAGVPSIIYGMLGLAVFVRALEPITSGSVFGVDSPNGRTVLAAGLTLGLLTLPVVIISSQEALRAVPNSLRQGALAVGATRWQTVRSQVIPVAVPGIMTGTILSIARAVGETAPLILVGAASFITVSPSSPFSQFTALPIQIFQWTALPQQEWRNLAAAASLTLLILLLTLNAGAVIIRNRYSRRMQ